MRSKMELNGVEIEDTFAEAFPIKVARVLITAVTERWAEEAAREATGLPLLSLDARQKRG